MTIAGLNILIFHGGIYRTVVGWDLEQATPVAAKAAALISASS